MPNLLPNGVEEFSADDAPSLLGLAFASSINSTVYAPTRAQLPTTVVLRRFTRAVVTDDPAAGNNGEYVHLPTSAGIVQWVRLYGSTPGGDAALRDSAIPTPQQGQRWYNTTLGTFEQYYAARATGNPLGATVAGWYADNTGDLTFSAGEYQGGFSAGSGGGLHYQRVNGIVTISGIVSRSPNTLVGTIVNMPVGFRSQNRLNSFYESSGVIRAELNVETNGNLTLSNNISNSTNAAAQIAYPAQL